MRYNARCAIAERFANLASYVFVWEYGSRRLWHWTEPLSGHRNGLTLAAARELVGVWSQEWIDPSRGAGVRGCLVTGEAGVNHSSQPHQSLSISAVEVNPKGSTNPGPLPVKTPHNRSHNFFNRETTRLVIRKSGTIRISQIRNPVALKIIIAFIPVSSFQ
jgi:hypothetical protein